MKPPRADSHSLPDATDSLDDLAAHERVKIKYWGMETADYKIGMLKKQQLYQQEGKRLISIYPADKPRLNAILRTKVSLFGFNVPPLGVGEQ